MKVQLIAASMVCAAGAMLAGSAAAAGGSPHMRDAREMLKSIHETQSSVGTMDAHDVSSGFVATAPCRIADTRPQFGGQGIIVAGTTRNFELDGDLSFQGGNAEGCDIPAEATSVFLNITATNTAAAGYFTVVPGGEPVPAVAWLTYGASQVISNAGAIGVGDGVDIFSFRNAHAVIDVTGYFVGIEPGELDCFTTENDGELAEDGEIFVGFASCPAGYAAVGGACDQSSNMQLLAFATFSEFDTHTCVYDNNTGADAGAWTDVACCRVQ